MKKKPVLFDVLMWALFGVMAALLLATAVVILTGCSPKVVQVEVAKHDTMYVSRDVRDSIYMRDSIYLHEYVKGDTVYIERDRWRDRYVDRWRHDTVYESRVDTLHTNTVEYKMTKWQRATSDLGKVLLLTLAVMAGWWVFDEFVRKK